MECEDLLRLPQTVARGEPWEEDVLADIRRALRDDDLLEASEAARWAVVRGSSHPLVLAVGIGTAAEAGDAEIVRMMLDRLDAECRRRGLERLPGWWRGRVVQTARTSRRLSVSGVFERRKPRARVVRGKARAAQAKAQRARTATKKRKAAAKKKEPARKKAAPERPTPPPVDPALAARVAWLPDTPPSLPEPSVELRVDDDGLGARLSAGTYDGLPLVRLARAAIDLRRARHFDDLLALRHVRGVDELPHQVETARRVLRDFQGKALLADEVGLGKTIEAGLVAKEYVLRGLARSVLILCPPSLVAQWRDEMASKFGLEFQTPGNNPAGFFERGDLLLCSIAFARRPEHRERATARRFDLVVVDEAHHVKNRRTLGFSLVDRLKRRFLLLLTATPVQNQLDELYDLVTLLKPGHLGTRGAFGKRFITRGDRRRPKDSEALRDLLADVMIRNTRALVDVRLPPRFVRTLRVPPTDRERTLYGAISDYVRARAKSDPGRQRPLLLTLLAEAGSSPAAVLSTLDAQLSRGTLPADHIDATRALQVQCAQVGGTAKADVLQRLLDEADGDKTAVFVKYRATLATLEGLLAARGVRTAVFHGGLAARDKEAAIDSFREEVPVLLSTESGGEGRNLQFCRRIVNFDLPWNPFSLEQRIGRVHRIGQTREVHVANLCGEGTAEDYLLTVLDDKLNMFELVVGELDMVLGDLEGDVAIPGRVFSIWTQAEDEAGVQAGFERLGDELEAARQRYGEERTYDEALFGRDYEAT